MPVQRIKEQIQKAIPDAEVYVVDPNQDGEHFHAVVISPSFSGLPLVRQHRMVMNSLKDAFAGDVHALGLKTFTPEKWKKEQKKGINGGRDGSPNQKTD
jgi:stress-induced morphogen